MRTTEPPSDADLLELFQQDPVRGWSLFLDRYSGPMVAYLTRQGMDYDAAMDRFVYVCEKLCEGDCRRLRTIKKLDRSGSLMSWLVTAIDHFCVDLLRAQYGRRRPFSVVKRLSALDQLVLDYYFQGYRLAEVYEMLISKHGFQVDFGELFESLERIFTALSSNQLWKLATGFRGAVEQLEEPNSSVLQGSDLSHSPETKRRTRYLNEKLQGALSGLPGEEQLLLKLRYERRVGDEEIAQMLDMGSGEAVRTRSREILVKLRRELCEQGMTFREISELGGEKLFSVPGETESGE